MCQILHIVFVWSEEGFPRFVFGYRGMLHEIDLFDQMALYAPDSIHARVARFCLIDEGLNLIEEFVHMWGMATVAEGTIFS